MIQMNAAEFAWPPTSKNVTIPKPIQKNRKDDMKFTFDPAKCDKIFDELLSVVPFGQLPMFPHLGPLVLGRRAHRAG